MHKAHYKDLVWCDVCDKVRMRLNGQTQMKGKRDERAFNGTDGGKQVG